MTTSDPSASAASDETADEVRQIEAQLPGLRDDGQHALVVALGERLLEIREAELGATDDKTLATVDLLAESYFQIARYARAEALLLRLISAREATGGAALGHVLAQLAKVHQATGARDEALALYERATAVYRATPESPPSRVADACHGLATLHEERGELDQAESMCRAAISIFEEHLGPDALPVAETLGTLAVIHARRGKVEEAERLGLRALAIREAKLGPDHPGLVHLLTNLAALYTQWRRRDRAGEVLARVSALLDARGGPEDLVTGAALEVIGLHRASTGDLAGGIDAARRALAVREEILGPSHPTVVGSINNLAVMLTSTPATFAEAEALFRRALDLVGDAPSARAGSMLLNLAMLRLVAGDLDEAEPLATRALTHLRAALGGEHLDVARALALLSQIAEQRGDVMRALEVMHGAFRIRSAHPDLDQGISDMTRIGQLMLAAGELDSAARFLRDALDLAANARGKDHPTVSHLIFLAGEVAMARKDPKQALFCVDRALAIDEKAHGRASPALIPLLHLQASAALALGKLGAAEATYRRIEGIMDDHPPALPETRAIPRALLGDVAMKRKAFAKAAELFESALAICEGVFGPDDARLSVMLEKTADAQAAAGGMARAGDLLRRLLSIHERQIGSDDAALLPIIQRLADVYLKTGDARAEEMVKRSIAGFAARTQETRAETSRIRAETARRRGRS